MDQNSLRRFLDAQKTVYQQAFSEITSGRKHSHWMWFIFPQYDGLGSSEMSRHYAIKSLDEARAYLAHPVLGRRLQECTQAALAIEDRSAQEIFGSPDDMKLRSCATLFAAISPPGSLFEQLLDKYFDGKVDDRTHFLIGRA